MSAREFDPLHLDVAAFAKEAGHLEGRWPLRRLLRLREASHEQALPGDTDEVTWRARGELLRVSGGTGQPWLHLEVSTRLVLECQRCLGPVDVLLEVQRSFLFVHGEDAAAQLDADSEDDVLALTRDLDLLELAEDELLLALPLVPRHPVCPEPLPQVPETRDDEQPHPFAALAALKRGRPVS